MELAFNYSARTPKGERLTGVIYAQTEDEAYHKLKKGLGYVPSSVSMNLRNSIANLVSKDFSRKELARFYKMFGRRMDKGLSIFEGLDNALEFVTDTKLSQAIRLMRQQIVDGNSLFTAMRIAGFPEKDVAAIKATEEAGKLATTLLSLSENIEREEKLRGSIVGVMRMPAVLMTIMYLMVYAVLVFIAPKMASFFQKLPNVQLPGFAEQFYAFADLFNQYRMVGSAIYFVVIPVGLIAFLRSDTFKQLIDRIPLVKMVSEKSDHASLWATFAMLFESGGINLEDVCKLLSNAARRRETRESFSSMGRLFRAGSSIGQAVKKAGFPDYIAKGVIAAAGSEALVEGLEDLANSLNEDVTEYSERLKVYIEVVSYLVMALFVFGYVMIIYYPSMTATLSQV